MTVVEAHQRRGVGTLMMKWGLKIADEIDAECIVESTEQGRRLYEHFGFVVQHDVTLEVPTKFSERPKQRLLMMYRQKKSRQSASEG